MCMLPSANSSLLGLLEYFCDSNLIPFCSSILTVTYILSRPDPYLFLSSFDSSFEFVFLSIMTNNSIIRVSITFLLSPSVASSFHLLLILDLIAACACKTYCTQPIMHSRWPNFLMTSCASSLSGHNRGRESHTHARTYRPTRIHAHTHTHNVLTGQTHSCSHHSVLKPSPYFLPDLFK